MIVTLLIIIALLLLILIFPDALIAIMYVIGLVLGIAAISALIILIGAIP